MADQTSASVNIHECSWADIEASLLVPGGASVPITDLPRDILVLLR